MMMKAWCSAETRMSGCTETLEENMEESDVYQNIQRVVCSVQLAPGLKQLEEWGWTESSPSPAPYEEQVRVLLSAGGVYSRDSPA